MDTEVIEMLKEKLPAGFVLVYPEQEDKRFNLRVAIHKCHEPFLIDVEKAIYTHLGVKPVNPNMVKAAHKAWKTIRAKKQKRKDAAKKAWKVRKCG